MSSAADRMEGCLSADWKSAETIVTESGLEWNSVTKSTVYRRLHSLLRYGMVEKKTIGNRVFWRREA